MDQYVWEGRKLQLDPAFPVCTQNTRLHHWWSEVLSSTTYSFVGKVVKACLSIFTGPKLTEWEVIPSVLFKQLDTASSMKRKSSLELYHRNNVQSTKVDRALIFHMQTAHGRP